jgi:hypothetical protein
LWSVTSFSTSSVTRTSGLAQSIAGY